MKKHPSDLGFSLGLKILIDSPSKIIFKESIASEITDIVYIATDETTQVIFKIGQTKDSLENRWKKIVKIFERENLRNNEKLDRKKWLDHARGKTISVWLKKAVQIEMPYAKELTTDLFSIRGAEELFLDHYYQPLIGMKLGKRFV